MNLRTFALGGLTALGASLLAMAAQAAPACTPSTVGDLNVYVKNAGCTFPPQTESSINLSNATSTTSTTGTSTGGVTVSFTSTETFKAANGNAVITPTTTTGALSNLTVSVPTGYTFTDLLFNVNLATSGAGSTKQVFPLSVSSTTGGPVSYSSGTLGNGQNTILALSSTPISSLVITSLLSGIGGITNISNFSISGLAPISNIPLPPAALLFGTALGGVGFLSRRRKAVA
ncbi:MAG: hypothetical protein U1E46_07040 [Hyphomicrobiales bacterium]